MTVEWCPTPSIHLPAHPAPRPPDAGANAAAGRARAGDAAVEGEGAVSMVDANTGTRARDDELACAAGSTLERRFTVWRYTF